MAQEADKNHIDELQNSLYSRNAPPVRTRRKLRLDDSTSGIQTSWQSNEGQEEVKPKELNSQYKNPNNMAFIKKLLIFSALFCVFAVGVGAYLFFNGANMISTDNIEIVVNSPVSISGGDPVTFEVVIKNGNSVDLELADLSVFFPSGTTEASDTTKELNSFKKMIGTIPARSTVKESVSAVLFGEENQQKQLEIALAFSVKGSTSVFNRKASHPVLIKSSPISVNVTSFKEVTSGQEFDVKIELKSNSDQVLKNLLLKADYPFGYELLSSSIPVLTDKQTWKIGDIPPGATKVLTLKGKIIGENDEQRSFNFTVGSAGTVNPQVIGTAFMSTQYDLKIEKPFISLRINIDNEEGAKYHVGEFGNSERVEIEWFNNLSVAVSNLNISAVLSGTAYDAASVQPNQGIFESGRNTIIWNARTNPEFGNVGPGESGTVSFTLVPRDYSLSGNNVVNPTINYKVNVSGRRSQESNVPENISIAATRESRIASQASLTGRVVRTVGPLSSSNSGPIPPRVDSETKYTVIWSVDNTNNALTNARVTSSLPPYVKWVGTVSPSSENINFDEATGIISWNVGNVSPYTFKTSKRREVAFQISLTPSINQVGQTLNLVNNATLQATDSFTGKVLESSQEMLNTRFSTDPGFREGDQAVSQ